MAEPKLRPALIPADDNLFSLTDAATWLGVSRDQAYALARAGQFPGAIRVGSRWRVSRRRYDHVIHGSAQVVGEVVE
jgi:excisionase family DNA binding protein